MRKILIFGNSGSGKSTLAKYLSDTFELAHLDLDKLAWKPKVPPERKCIEESRKEIYQFVASNHGWVIEGCYIDLISLIEKKSTEIIFMDLPVEACISNAKARQWEPHKYESKEAQDDNLEMLINWIGEYTERKDAFSYDAHKTFYDNYSGQKKLVTCNEKYI